MSEEFTLNYHAATIQHLGIGLYKQLPQAIAELITNSWDADSHNVKININYKEKIMGTIYQFTLDTRYSIFENIKKGDFQTETVF